MSMPDAPVVQACEPGTPSENRDTGQSCACDQQCGSGACIAGVCCTSRCEGSCQACDLPGKVGTCSPIPEGQAPSNPEACPKDPVASCGLEGTCDGKGECRKYPDNTVCEAGSCKGSSVAGTKTCRNGECTAGINQICAPFSCNAATSTCFAECTKDQDCAEGRTCKDGSCGEGPAGSACKSPSQCESGHCVDGVCCNTACKGACLTCNDPSSLGACAPVKSGVKDPRLLCVTDNASTCGFSGLCNGQGGCSRYDASTVCQVASCAGASVMPEAKCNGLGNCVLSSAFTCAPSICSGGACKTECASNADCIAPATCNDKSCGKRGPGQACASADQCGSGFCADGVCCNQACSGQCRNCALANSRGQCVNVPADTMDPRIAAGVTNSSLVCKDEGMASCGTSGMCNGAGACSRYPSGTLCKAGSCDPVGNSSVAPSTCNGNGACLSPPPLTCAPFRCSGSRCADVCGGNTDCVSPNVCSGGSCGKKGNGQGCGASAECNSGHCEQGICCGTPCDKSCFSCALPGKEGSCSAMVAGGLDPKGVCKDNGAASCGTDGTCNGSGSCRLYNASTMCKGQSCASGVTTAAAFCSGTGICIAGATRDCDPYECNTAGTACFESCITATECKAPNSCALGNCGAKGIGAPCTLNSDCGSNFCADRVCCDEACTGLCRACNVSGSVGACTNVPQGVADSEENTCRPTRPEDCGNDGTCDGRGGCNVWGADTRCSMMSCPEGASAITNSSNCNGMGSCMPQTEQLCGNSLCNSASNTCKTSCTPETQTLDCKAGFECVNIGGKNICGLKPQGASCRESTECSAGLFCIDETCCNKDKCGTCQSCKNAQGVCANVVAGEKDLDSCVSDNNNVCGTIGICDGAGSCRTAPETTICGESNCTADGREERKQCNGSGTCTTTTITCSNNFRCEGQACRTSCRSDADCLGGLKCPGNSKKCQ